MTTIKEVLSEAASAISIATLIEGAAIAVFLAGVFVAFALAITP
jgi:hypothetical protein